MQSDSQAREEEPRKRGVVGGVTPEYGVLRACMLLHVYLHHDDSLDSVLPLAFASSLPSTG